MSFEEDGQEYTMLDVDGQLKKDFPSVSKVIKLFYDEFPTEEAARKKAKGDPKNLDSVLVNFCLNELALNLKNKGNYNNIGTHREGSGGLWQQMGHQGIDSDGIIAAVKKLV